MKTKSLFMAIAAMFALAACDNLPIDIEGGDVEQVPTFTVTGIKGNKVTLGAEGGSAAATIVSNVNWTVESSEAWVAVDPAKHEAAAVDTVTVTLTIAPNEATEARSCTVTFKVEDLPEVTVKVSQDALVPDVTVLEVYDSNEKAVTSVDVDFLAGQVSFLVLSSKDWTATSDVDWATVTPAQGAGNEEDYSSVVVEYTMNAGDAREASITIDAVGAAAPVVVKVCQAKGEDLTATVDLMLVSEYLGQAHPNYPDASCLVTDTSYPSATIVSGYYGVWQSAAWEEELANWDTNQAAILDTLMKYGNPMEEDDLEYVNDLDPEEGGMIYVWSKLNPATEYVYIVYLVDEYGRTLLDYATATTAEEEEAPQDDWFTTDDFLGSMNKENYCGSYYMFGYDYFDGGYVYWPVVFEDAGVKDSDSENPWEAIKINGMLPYNAFAEGSGFNVEWYNGFLYFTPDYYEGTFADGGSDYDVIIETFNSMLGKPSTKDQLLGGVVEDEEMGLILAVVNHPYNEAYGGIYVNGIYAVVDGLGGLCAFNHIYFVPVGGEETQTAYSAASTKWSVRPSFRLNKSNLEHVSGMKLSVNQKSCTSKALSLKQQSVKTAVRF